MASPSQEGVTISDCHAPPPAAHWRSARRAWPGSPPTWARRSPEEGDGGARRRTPSGRGGLPRRRRKIPQPLLLCCALAAHLVDRLEECVELVESQFLNRRHVQVGEDARAARVLVAPARIHDLQNDRLRPHKAALRI